MIGIKYGDICSALVTTCEIMFTLQVQYALSQSHCNRVWMRMARLNSPLRHNNE
jgi:hypothetical protein